MHKSFEQFGLKETTKFGIDTLDLTIEFVSVLCAEEVNDLEDSIGKVKKFIEEKAKRELTNNEYLNLLHGCLDYIMSDPATNERAKSMDYLFTLGFMNE